MHKILTSFAFSCFLASASLAAVPAPNPHATQILFEVVREVVILPAAVRQAVLGTGADVNAQDSNGRTPLSYAMEQGNSAAIGMLLEFGALITDEALDRCQEPMKRAFAEIKAREGRPEVGAAAYFADHRRALVASTGVCQAELHDFVGFTEVRTLVGGDECRGVFALRAEEHELLIQDGLGRTPLHRAACSGFMRTVELFLGALNSRDQAAAQDNDGKTPLDLAREHGHANVIVRLEYMTHSYTDGAGN